MGRASRPRGPAKVVAHADPVEIERPRPAGITLSRGTKVPQTARGRRTELYVLHVQRAYNAIKPQPSAPELDERQARPREKQSRNRFRRGKGLDAVVTFIGSREHTIEIGGGFFGILVQLEGGGRQRGQYGPEHRYGRRNIRVRQDDLYCGCLCCGCLCCRRRVATQKYSEQHNNRLYITRLLFSNSCSSTLKRRNSLPRPPNPSSYRLRMRGGASL
jgi:hypothetical protein